GLRPVESADGGAGPGGRALGAGEVALLALAGVVETAGADADPAVQAAELLHADAGGVPLGLGAAHVGLCLVALPGQLVDPVDCAVGGEAVAVGLAPHGGQLGAEPLHLGAEALDDDADAVGAGAARVGEDGLDVGVGRHVAVDRHAVLL